MHKRFASQIPDVITNDKQLQASIEMLPSNYNFEIYKTIWRIKTTNSKCVALQFPEGLLIYACTIADILQSYTGVETVVMGDVTYGACCVDDLTAKALGADLLVHYGHSCLVPIDRTEGINLLYVFVDIQINTQHFLDTVRAQFTEGSKLAFVSTIQFLPSLHQVAADLSQSYKITIPQVKPLSPGEVLGCTSPRLPPGIDAIVYLADGRFHLESIMISNPDVPAYKYDPYDKTFTHEIYDHVKMRENRHNQIKLAAKANKFAVVLGTLGRQGSTKILETIKSSLEQAGKQYVIVLLSELFPEKLKLFTDIEAWVQIACPRLSIDWGLHFHAPVLTPYELSVALELVEWQVMYPMDFYANNSLGPWTVNNEKHRPKPKSRRPKQKKPAATPHATATCATPQATATCATGCGTETSCCSDTY